MQLNNLNRCISVLKDSGCGENFALRFGVLDCYYDRFYGENLNADTNFDMASVSKIFCTTTLCLIAMDEGKLTPETLVSGFFPVPKDKDNLSIKHLMIHSMGFGHKRLDYSNVNYDNVAEYIVNIPCEFPVGSETEYCCPAFILLGKIVEKIYGKRLDILFKEKIAEPLMLSRTAFGSEKVNVVNSNSTEEELGKVNDYNCRHLGCIAGNAGLYSNLNDLTKFTAMLLREGSPLIKEETFRMARKNHTPDFSSSRGLGFLYVDSRYRQTGDLFNTGSFGHCGHTGQCVFVDPSTGFFSIVLSDMTIKVHNEYDRVIKARELIHNAIKADLNIASEFARTRMER